MRRRVAQKNLGLLVIEHPLAAEPDEHRRTHPRAELPGAGSSEGDKDRGREADAEDFPEGEQFGTSEAHDGAGERVGLDQADGGEVGECEDKIGDAHEDDARDEQDDTACPGIEPGVGRVRS